jgi:hypothetical protein
VIAKEKRTPQKTEPVGHVKARVRALPAMRATDSPVGQRVLMDAVMLKFMGV